MAFFDEVKAIVFAGTDPRRQVEEIIKLVQAEEAAAPVAEAEPVNAAVEGDEAA